jgi:hypothetical protein
MIELTICPVCESEFEVITWKCGDCKCGNKYAWTEECTDDYSECWPSLYWNRYKDSSGTVIKNDSFEYVF